MESSQILNLTPNPPETSQGNSHPADEFNQMGDLIEQTRSDVRRIRMQMERQEDEQESHSRRTKILSIVLGLLIVILAGAVWFAYPAVRDQQQTAVQLLGLKDIAGALGGQVESMQAKLKQTADGFPALTSRMDQLQSSMKSTLQTAGTQAQAAATQVGQRIRQDFNQTFQAIQSRLAGLESNQHEASERVSQLQEQIAGLKQELASMREESTNSAVRIKQLQEEQQVRSTALASLDQKMASHQTSLDSLSSRMDRKRIEFDLPKRQTEQIVPGIYLTIRRTDAGKQEIDGTLQLGAESQMLPIRGQGVQKPMMFYTGSEQRPVELVFTQVTKNGVHGYVMMPAPGITAASVDNTASEVVR
jgi:chromosome segregation ATPase